MKIFIVLILFMFGIVSCINNSSGGEDIYKNCKYYFDEDIDDTVFYDLDTGAYYAEGKTSLLKLLNTVPVQVQQSHYGYVKMYFLIDTNGNVLKVGFEKPISSLLEEKLISLFKNTGGWVSGKCGKVKVISKVNLSFTW